MTMESQQVEMVLTGIPAVAGIAVGPVVRPAPRVSADVRTGPIPESDRDAEAEALRAAAATVAARLRERAAAASGAAAEVLAA
ncbi:phosphoenolpyruvate-utilizing N-terminal domain-containing protein, partial [Nocardia puris]